MNILMHAFHMRSRWYTSQLHVVHSGNELYVPPWHRSLYPRLEEFAATFL